MTAPLHRAGHLPKAPVGVGTPRHARPAPVCRGLHRGTGAADRTRRPAGRDATPIGDDRGVAARRAPHGHGAGGRHLLVGRGHDSGRIVPAGPRRAGHVAGPLSSRPDQRVGGRRRSGAAGGTRSGGRAQLGDTLDGPAPLRRDHSGSRLQRAPGVLSAGRRVPCRGQQPDAVVDPSCCGPGLRDRGLPLVQRPDHRGVPVARGVGGRLPRRLVGRARRCATTAQSPFPPRLERRAGGGDGPRPRPRGLGRGGAGHAGHRRHRRPGQRLPTRSRHSPTRGFWPCGPGPTTSSPCSRGTPIPRIKPTTAAPQPPSAAFSRAPASTRPTRRSWRRPMPPSARTPRCTDRSAPTTTSAISPAP